eukprot:scaffold492_cov341-Pavlova_lutheri.AAC.16
MGARVSCASSRGHRGQSASFALGLHHVVSCSLGFHVLAFHAHCSTVGMRVGGDAHPATPWNSVSPPAACGALGGGDPSENPSCPGPGSGSIGTCGVYVSGEPNPGLSGGVSPSMESACVAFREGRVDALPISWRKEVQSQATKPYVRS